MTNYLQRLRVLDDEPWKKRMSWCPLVVESGPQEYLAILGVVMQALQ